MTTKQDSLASQTGSSVCNPPGANLGNFTGSLRLWARSFLLALALNSPACEGPVEEQGVAPKFNPDVVTTNFDSRPELGPLTIQDLSEGDAKLVVETFRKYGIDQSLEPEPGWSPSYTEKQKHRLAIEALPAKEILAKLVRVAENISDSRGEHARYCLANINTMLRSPEFHAAVALIKEEDPKCSSPVGELAMVWWPRDPKSLEIFINTFQSHDFKIFREEIKKGLAVDVHRDLACYVSIYSRGRVPGGPHAANQIIDAVNRVTAVLPNVQITSAKDLAEISFWIKAGSNDYIPYFEDWLQNLTKSYQAVMQADLIPNPSLAKLRCSEHAIEHIGRLAKPDAIDLFHFLRDRYPTLTIPVGSVDDLIFSDEGPLKKYVEPILDRLSVDGPTLVEFLNLFGKEIHEVDLGVLGADLPRSPKLDISSLLENQAGFVRFLDTIFKEIPSLQSKLDAHTIKLAVHAFNDYPTYQELNRIIPSASGSPILSLESADLKIKIANALKGSDFDQVQIYHEAFDGLTERDLKAILTILEGDLSPISQSYQTLSKIWDLRELKLEHLFILLTLDESDLRIILDPNSKVKLNDIVNQLYPGEDAGNPDLGAIIKYVPSIVTNQDLLCNLQLVTFTSQYRFRGIHDYQTMNLEGRLQGLADLVHDWKPKSVDIVEEFIEAANLLETQYQFSPPQARIALEGKWNAHGDSYIGAYLSDLKAPALENAFRFLEPRNLSQLVPNGAYDNLLKGMENPVERLDSARQVLGITTVSDVIGTIFKLGAMVDEPDSFLQIVRNCIDNPELQDMLKDEEFCDFIRQVTEHFYHGVFDPAGLANYQMLYQRVKDSPGLRELLFSPNFKYSGRLIGAAFEVATLRPEALSSLLEVCRDLDLDSFEHVLKSLYEDGAELNGNDAFLVAELSRDPSLMSRLRDRSALERLINRRFTETPAIPRKDIDELIQTTRITKDTPAHVVTRLKTERAAILKVQEGRPDLSQIPTLHLLRVALIIEMLDDVNSLENLGRLIAKDVANRRTELGGQIQISAGRAILREIESTALYDGSYQSPIGMQFNGALATFHLHAREVDEGSFSGPSSTDADLVRENRDFDIVFTTMGHTIDQAGQIDPSRVRVNADCCFSVDGKLVIVDLGAYTVPYDALLGNGARK